MTITYKNGISVDEVNALRKAMGWRRLLPEQLNASLKGSVLVIAAYAEDTAIGMARLVWDGGGVATIPGVVIHPKHANCGVESELIAQLLDYLRKKLKPGFGIQVDVKAFGCQERLYEALGFQVSTVEQRGLPMHICLSDQIELTDEMFQQMDFIQK